MTAQHRVRSFICSAANGSWEPILKTFYGAAKVRFWGKVETASEITALSGHSLRVSSIKNFSLTDAGKRILCCSAAIPEIKIVRKKLQKRSRLSYVRACRRSYSKQNSNNVLNVFLVKSDHANICVWHFAALVSHWIHPVRPTIIRFTLLGEKNGNSINRSIQLDL